MSFTLPLHIIPKDGKIAELLDTAAALDEMETGDRRDAYTVPQAFVALLTFAPHRLAEFASGWYVDNTPVIDDPATEDTEEDQTNVALRLEYLRGELRAERISQGELYELQTLAKHIDPGDTELLEAAGVPEHADEDRPDTRCRYCGAAIAYVAGFWRDDFEERGAITVGSSADCGAREGRHVPLLTGNGD